MSTDDPTSWLEKTFQGLDQFSRIRIIRVDLYLRHIDRGGQFAANFLSVNQRRALAPNQVGPARRAAGRAVRLRPPGR